MDHSAPIPHIAVNDGEAAIKFYEAAFGAECQNKRLSEDGKNVMHAHVQLGGDVFFLHDLPELGAQGAKAPGRLGGTSFVIHLEVPDADVAWERAVKAGAQIVMPLDNQFWGMRYGQLRDPFGHIWAIGGPVKESM